MSDGARDEEADVQPDGSLCIRWRGQEFRAARPTFAILDIRLMGDLCDVFWEAAERVREAEERAGPGDSVAIARAARIADDAARELRERAGKVADEMGLRPICIACVAPDEVEEEATAAAIEFVAALREALNARMTDRGKSAPLSGSAA